MDQKQVSMFSPNPRIIRRFCLLFCLFICVIKLQSQCNPPQLLPTVQCENAPLTCLQDACYSTLNIPDQGWPEFCGVGTLIHNPQYFQVLPVEPCIQINIHVDNCSGMGLQSALVTSCQWQPCQPPGTNPWVPCADVLDCDPGAMPGETMMLEACGLTPGVPLWVLIDGSNGALCQYTIEYAQGIFEPQIDEEIMSGEASPTSVCQGYDDLLMTVAPAITNAHGYAWTLGWNGQVETSSTSEIMVDIPNNADPGTYEVCVIAYSGCDTTEFPFCFEVEIYEIDDEVKEPETFCPEEFPFAWHEVTISGPGDYEQSFEDADGCRFDSIWTVEEFPEVPVGELPIVFCMNENLDPFIYEGEVYDDPGIYILEYPGMGLNGCDSTAELDLTLIGIQANIEHTCENGEFILTAHIQETIPGNAEVTFQWFVDGVLTHDNNPMAILCSGTSLIELEITVETPEGSCVFNIDPYTLNCDAEKPAAPVTNGDTLLCAQDGVYFYVIEDPFGEPLTYTWTSPPGVEINDLGGGEVEMDFSFTTGGEVCVYAENDCGIGPATCFIVDIIEPPVADFSFDPALCIDESTTITFTGDAGPNAQYIWDFDGASSVTGSGAGPYTVSWNITGDKLIKLTVIEPGCDTADDSGIIVVSNLLMPTINCSSTLDSVNFDWDDVAGASNYLVSINGGAPISTTVSNFGYGGLIPGTVVNLTLTVQSAGPCPDIVLMHSCTAVDCPPPSIVLSGPDSLCLNSPGIVLYQGLVNGLPGMGLWTGLGIVDAVTGAFDPQVSGSGQHQLTYTVDFNGCPFSDSYLVTVFDSITADFVVDPVICITDVANLTYTGNASGGAAFSYNFGGGTVVSGSGSGPFQISYPTPGSKSVSLQITENGCTSDLITQSLSVEPELTAPVVSCATSTSGVTFSWPNTPTGFIYNILTGQTGNQINPTEIEFTGLTPGDIVEIEIISLNPGPCPIRKDTFSCEAKDCLPILIALTPVPDICLYAGTSVVNLEAIVTGGTGVGDWSGPGITDPVNGRFDPSVAGIGSHVITYHFLSVDDCDFFETLTINIFGPPDAIISNTSLILTCTSGSLVLDGSASTGTGITFEWSTSNGSFISVQNLSMATVDAQGVYQLLVTNASGCVDSVSVTVSLDANAPIAQAGPDKVITCDSLSFVLGGASSVGASISYMWSSPDGNIVGADDGIRITVDEPGTYTIAVLDASNGCQTFDEAIVTIDTTLSSITLTAGDTIDCNTKLSGVQSALSGNVADYDLQWTTVDGTISGSTTTPDIAVSQGGTYTLTIKNRDNGCTRSASAFVAESDEIIDAVDVSLSNVVCFGDQNGTLTINSVTGGTQPYTYNWSNGQASTTLQSLSPGQYTLTVSDQNGCSFTQVFTITEPPKVTADLGSNFTVSAGDSVKIDLMTNVSSGAVSSIDWTTTDGLTCPDCPSLQFIASASGTIIAVVTDTAGCSALDSVRLTVLVPRIVFIPNTFSPNDDGINDYFFISGRFNLINIGYLQVYDRWGNQVFADENLSPGIEAEGWNGKYNDQPMQPGVYVYTARLDYEDGVKEVIKGDITIIR